MPDMGGAYSYNPGLVQGHTDTKRVPLVSHVNPTVSFHPAVLLHFLVVCTCTEMHS